MTDSKIIHGAFIGHSMNRGFVWQYGCESCGREFRESCPEVHAPAVCHTCYSGIQEKRDHRKYAHAKRANK